MCKRRLFRAAILLIMLPAILLHCFPVYADSGTSSISGAEARAAVSTTGSSTVTYQVPSGDSQTFNFVPDAGFYVIDVQVDEVSQGVATSYTFSNLSADHTLSVTFGTSGVVKNSRSGTFYSSIQDAYNAASDGDNLLTRNVQFMEHLTADRNISLVIDGGYNSDFSANPDKTTLRGAPVISGGIVMLKNYVISN